MEYKLAKLLIVDDSLRHASSLAELFKMKEFPSVQITTEPRQVNQLHITNDFDLIILDLEMPGFNGFDVMQRLKQGQPDDYLPVLVVTAYASHKCNALAAGALDVLIKPYDINELLLRVKNTVEVRLLYKAMAKDLVEQKEIALHDALTGLPNRRLIMDRLENALRFAKRNNSFMAILYIDLDDFKEINDRFGHACGDRVLQFVANCLSGSVRQSDTVGRLGGDEFIMILQEVKSVEEVSVPAQKILEFLSAPFLINEHQLRIGASVGVAIYPDHGQTAELLLNRADTALYEVKRSGKKGYSIGSIPP